MISRSRFPVLKAHFLDTLELASASKRMYKKSPLEIHVKAMELLDFEDSLALRV
jgi:hypothetical protein